MSRIFSSKWVRMPLTNGMLAMMLLLASPPAAADHAFNLGEGSVLIHGFDPVAYFINGVATRGEERHVVTYQGARILFASAANQRRFEADPEHYMPQFGGFCAYGVRMGKKFDIDPEAWEIADGKLYVMLDRSTQALWKQEKQKNIAIGNQTWRRIRDVPPPQLE